MALLEEQFTETLQAGAPDITYKGNEGQEQKIARELWDQLPPQAKQQFGNFQQFFSSGAWKQVLQMLQKQMQQGQPPQQAQQGLGSMMPAQMANGGMLMASASDPWDDRNQISLQLFGKALHELNPDEEMQLDDWLEDKAQKWQGAYGGIAGADGRRAYGIGSWFQKKIMDPIKKNPLIAAAALGAGVNFLPASMPGSGWITQGLQGLKNKGITSTLGKIISDPKWMIPAASLVAGAFAKPEQQLEGGAMSRGAGINLQDIAKLANITDEKQGQAIGLNFLPEASARKYSPEEMALTYAATEGAAKGGRIGAQEGGLMSLGGMEMDLRGGGFVPIGAKEKADDVPARLSKNEFVFTADAVRAAGDGDVDAGADKMYNTMKQLESRVG
jgi:hypothetical protein